MGILLVQVSSSFQPAKRRRTTLGGHHRQPGDPGTLQAELNMSLPSVLQTFHGRSDIQVQGTDSYNALTRYCYCCRVQYGLQQR